MQLKVGELARRTGLTVRTLHHDGEGSTRPFNEVPCESRHMEGKQFLCMLARPPATQQPVAQGDRMHPGKASTLVTTLQAGILGISLWGSARAEYAILTSPNNTAPGVEGAADRMQADWSAFRKIVASDYWRKADLQALHATCQAAAELALARTSSTQMSHEACVSAALRALDDRSRYITAEESRDMDKQPRKLVGIALELSRPEDPGPIHIVTPLQGGPAERAGLLPGDDVYSIDGVDVTSLSMRDAISRFRGEPGTHVSLVVGRGDRRDLTFTIVREEIRVRRARASFLQKERALWMRVSQFTDEVPVELAKAIRAAVGSSPVRPHMIVLDLRGSVGGLLQSAVDTAALFLAPGTEVFREHAQAGSTVRRLSPTFDEKLTLHVTEPVLKELRGLPMTVLVDGRTASGSEMFATAMKEMRRARVVGAASYGDNTISKMLPLPSGARIELPVAKMTSPAGVSWENGGVPLDEVRQEGTPGEYGDIRSDELLRYVVSH